MNVQKISKKWAWAGLAVIIVAAGFIPIYYFVIRPNSGGTHPFEVTFGQDQMYSCPGHTAWFVGEIHTETPMDGASGPAIAVTLSTSAPVQADYTLWQNADGTHVLEVFVQPNATHTGQTIAVTVNATIGDKSATATLQVGVIEWTAAVNMTQLEPVLAPFINYIAAEHSEWGIDNETAWNATFNSIQILVVEHFLLKSASYELELSRHAMIAPYDWIQVYLRPRNATAPVWAAEIPSYAAWLSGNHTIEEIDPPAEIYRGATEISG